MTSDWLIAMCEIVVSNEWRHSVRYGFFHPRYDVITWTKSRILHVMTSCQWRWRQLPNVKQHKWLPHQYVLQPEFSHFFKWIIKQLINSVILTGVLYVRNSWVSLCKYAVNLSGGQPQLYWCFCCTGKSKWQEIARICYETRGKHIQWTFNSLPWRYLDLELTPTEIYDVTWNPRILLCKVNVTLICVTSSLKNVVNAG